MELRDLIESTISAERTTDAKILRLDETEAKELLGEAIAALNAITSVYSILGGVDQLYVLDKLIEFSDGGIIDW